MNIFHSVSTFQLEDFEQRIKKTAEENEKFRAQLDKVMAEKKSLEKRANQVNDVDAFLSFSLVKINYKFILLRSPSCCILAMNTCSKFSYYLHNLHCKLSLAVCLGGVIIGMLLLTRSPQCFTFSMIYLSIMKNLFSITLH